MDDETLHQIAAKVDTAIRDLCIQHGTGPLALSGIILARLTWLNDQVNDGKDFRNLCRFISNLSFVNQYPEPQVDNVDQAQELLRRFNINNDGDKQ